MTLSWTTQGFIEPILHCSLFSVTFAIDVTDVHRVDPTLFFVFSDFVHTQRFDTGVHRIDGTLSFDLSLF